MKFPTINYRTVAVDLLQGLGIALLFSFFIYAEYFSLTNSLVNSITALSAFYFLLKAPGRVLASAGGFIGLLWFYWIGYSFEYYHMGWMGPYITLFFIILYALFFGILTFTKIPFYRAAMLFGLSFVEPMDWNWLQIELPFINSLFGIEKWQYALILLALSLFIFLSSREALKQFRFAALILLLGAVDFSTLHLSEPDLKIKLYAPMLLQEDKWLQKNRQQIINRNMKAVTDATAQHYDLVVLPESAFPLFLNQNRVLTMQLQGLSQQIDIITGALYIENGRHYNVSYHFSKGEVKIAKKMVLVPFGEYIPLPEFMRSWINKTFFDGLSDFVTADKPSDFTIKGVKFRNAICYEATCEEIYDGEPSYLIAISNNGWFYPSIEPTLQTLLMRFYAKKHHTIIYHSANMGGSGIIKGY
ncbi:MAG: apolipoprotein N-acyltransferase [Helicobacteraceae bacterium]|jgi:apolipoprotein N-acyltransferase|nr:apolipoprotein N-acyltransferase [Helicobacteraceae bacterium]